MEWDLQGVEDAGLEVNRGNARLASYPRLFLVEERAWQHYFHYIMVHVIYSNHALFLKIIM